MAEIKDSGMRREFETGAVRDICADEKGRCDLLPLDVVAQQMHSVVLNEIEGFKQTHDVIYLHNALDRFCSKRYRSKAEMMLEVSIHFADGAKKYSPDNWKKGIPLSSYIDSGIRHYLKWLAGWEDERHDRAFVWNMLCAIWTKKHKPELDDIGGTYTLEEVVEELGVELETGKPKRKTFLENYFEEHPQQYKGDYFELQNCVDDVYGTATDCEEDCGNNCRYCWNRVMPECTSGEEKKGEGK